MRLASPMGSLRSQGTHSLTEMALSQSCVLLLCSAIPSSVTLTDGLVSANLTVPLVALLAYL